MPRKTIAESSGHVLIADLADEFGIDRSHARKYLLNQGFEFIRVRTLESGNQEMIALSTQDADLARHKRAAQGFSSELLPETISGNATGCFYVVQPVPELDLNRVKLGFTVNLEGRLQNYRTICPSAVAIRIWSCDANWERTAIDSVTRIECVQLGVELFRCADVDQLIKRCEQFFALMPVNEINQTDLGGNNE